MEGFDPKTSFGLRLANPPEFDLMARIAGLRLRKRTGGWHGEPFTASSCRHVSVYEHADRDDQEPGGVAHRRARGRLGSGPEHGGDETGRDVVYVTRD